LVSASGAFFFTDSIPLSREATDSYISLLPMICPFVAFKLKYGLPFLDSNLSKRASSCEFFTDSIPFKQAAFVV
jgi:hypothetical protein